MQAIAVTEEQTLLHIMDDQKRIASLRTGADFGDTKPPIQYFLDDHLSSSNIVLNSSGGLESREEYYPFGETSFGSFTGPGRLLPYSLSAVDALKFIY